MQARTTLRHIKVLLVSGLLIVSQLAHANAGVPMIFLVMPAFAFSIVPIIILESFYIANKLQLSRKVVYKTVTVSNLVSTIVGIPAAWILLVSIQLITGGGSAYGIDTTIEKILAVTWQAPWLIPYEHSLNWMIPVAGTVLLVPLFFISWWFEYLVSKSMLKEVEPNRIKLLVRNANLITYSLMMLWPIIYWFIY